MLASEEAPSEDENDGDADDKDDADWDTADESPLVDPCVKSIADLEIRKKI